MNTLMRTHTCQLRIIFVATVTAIALLTWSPSAKGLVQHLLWRWPAPSGLAAGFVVKVLVAQERDSTAQVVYTLFTAGNACAAWLPIATTFLEDGCLIKNCAWSVVFNISHTDGVRAEARPCFVV
jgi:hypothetical protein